MRPRGRARNRAPAPAPAREFPEDRPTWPGPDGAGGRRVRYSDGVMCSESKPRIFVLLLVSYMTLANGSGASVELVQLYTASAWANRGTRGARDCHRSPEARLGARVWLTACTYTDALQPQAKHSNDASPQPPNALSDSPQHRCTPGTASKAEE